MGKKPLKERLKQDIALLLVVLLFAGGILPVLSRSAYFVPLAAIFLVITFGPYLIEFANERKATKNDRPEKIVITTKPEEDGNEDISIKLK